MLPEPQNSSKLAADVLPQAFVDYREYLDAIYRALKKVKGSYSYIQFAADLGFSKTNVVHLVIRGKRPLTLKAAQKIASHLELKGEEKEYFLTLVTYAAAKSPAEKDASLSRLLRFRTKKLEPSQHRLQIEYLSEWYHPVVREMTLLPQFMSEGGWIADRIQPRIRPEQARKSLLLLEKLGMIRFDQEQGRHVAQEQNVTSGDEVDSLSVVRYHQSMIDLGKDSISNVGEEERDIGAVTVSVDEKTADLMKLEIQQFRKRMMSLADQVKSPNRVFQVNMQFFPLTKKQEDL